MTFSEEFKRNLTFRDYCDDQYREKSIGGNRMHTETFELKITIGKFSLPYFDGYAECTTNSWVQKLDTYFQLNPMAERDSIMMGTLH